MKLFSLCGFMICATIPLVHRTLPQLKTPLIIHDSSTTIRSHVRHQWKSRSYILHKIGMRIKRWALCQSYCFWRHLARVRTRRQLLCTIRSALIDRADQGLGLKQNQSWRGHWQDDDWEHSQDSWDPTEYHSWRRIPSHKRIIHKKQMNTVTPFFRTSGTHVFFSGSRFGEQLLEPKQEPTDARGWQKESRRFFRTKLWWYVSRGGRFDTLKLERFVLADVLSSAFDSRILHQKVQSAREEECRSRRGSGSRRLCGRSRKPRLEPTTTERGKFFQHFLKVWRYHGLVCFLRSALRNPRQNGYGPLWVVDGRMDETRRWRTMCYSCLWNPQRYAVQGRDVYAEDAPVP